MTSFLVIAAIATVLVGTTLVWPLLMGGRQGRGRDSADAALFRDQLAELDRDVARGTISEAEAEGARAEIARRLIAATKRANTATDLAPAPKRISRIAAIAALLTAPALSAALYLYVGAPGQPDQPLAARTDPAVAGLPSQAEAERMAAGQLPATPPVDPDYAALLERLEQVVASRPNDIEGHRLLARALARAGRWTEARQIFDRLIELLGENVTPQDLADQAETMIFAAGGYVSPQATDALSVALQQDPANTMARYYAGFALRQAGRDQQAIALWSALLAEDKAAAAPQGEAWQAALAALIDETQGVRPPGPTRDDVEAAEEMTAEERAAFIATMVARLEDRLTNQGGKPEDWVRLINAYVQQGKMDDAQRVLAMSQQSLSDNGAKGFVREQALLMGVKAQ